MSSCEQSNDVPVYLHRPLSKEEEELLTLHTFGKSGRGLVPGGLLWAQAGDGGEGSHNFAEITIGDFRLLNCGCTHQRGDRTYPRCRGAYPGCCRGWFLLEDKILRPFTPVCCSYLRPIQDDASLALPMFL
uniref:Uncharacterized protein n=1 Tax=Sicyonia whispovirus TaxID=2984283 RepID=A0A9C7F0U5_9VIRU|nr:MAG: hypothetical protein [Sicyonia whispovirus]